LVTVDPINEIAFSKETDYIIYLSNGSAIRRGRGAKVSIADLKPGGYLIGVNGETSGFEKRQ
jgi:hypothetical protein